MDGSILPLVDAIDPERFGGKASRLAQAMREGLPVPGGFALSFDAVEWISGASDLEPLRKAISEGLTDCGQELVAVRSSGVDEDGKSASYAGQYATVLGRQGVEQIRDAIREIYASASSKKLEIYQRQMEREIGGRVAVVVQRLVDADVAGVLFTRDPVSGSGDRWIIEASWGLGESVVGGRVSPDCFVVDTSGKVLESHAGEKLSRLDAVLGGGTMTTEIEEEDLIHEPCLNPADLVALVELAQRCRTIFGEALDIEWAFRGGKPVILQIRPITALR